MNELTKDVVVIVSPGVVEAAPVPPKPAYTETRHYDIIGVIRWEWVSAGTIVNGEASTALFLTPIYGTIHVTDTIYHPAEPALPAVLGAPIITRDYQLGWTGGAASVDNFSGNAQFHFSLDQSASGIVCGLNESSTNVGYQEIDFAIYAETGQFRVLEHGVIKTGYYTFVDTDVFTIRRLGDEIAYFKNDTLIYTSLTRTTALLRADCSIYAGGSQITDASFSSLTVDFAEVSGTVEMDLGGIAIRMAESGGYANLAMDLGEIDIVADVWNIGTVEMDLGGVTLAMSDGLANVVAMDLGDVEIEMESGYLTPTFNALSMEIGGFGAYGRGLVGNVGEVEMDLGGIVMRSSDYAYSDLTMDLGDLDIHMVDLGPYELGYGYGELAALEGTAFGYVDQVVDADGNPVTYGGIGHLAALTGQGYGGGVGDGDLAALSGAGVGQITIAGTGDGTFAALTGSGVGQITFVGAGASTFGALTGVGYAGGVGEGEFSGLEFTGVGSVGLVGFGDSDFAALRGTAIGLLGLVGYGDGDLAALEAGVFSVGLGTFAALEGYGSGLIVVTATYEGYNFTFAGESVLASHLTNFPFKRILRWKDRHIAMTETGLYVLGGDTFDGDLILADVITGEDDFGIPNAKRPRSVWIPGRGGNDLAVSIVGSEVDPEESGTVDEGTGSRNRRALFGKGVRARYLAYRVRNMEGEDFAIDALGPEFDALRRYS